MEMIVKSDIKNDNIREITFAHTCLLSGSGYPNEILESIKCV